MTRNLHLGTRPKQTELWWNHSTQKTTLNAYTFQWKTERSNRRIVVALKETYDIRDFEWVWPHSETHNGTSVARCRATIHRNTHRHKPSSECNAFLFCVLVSDEQLATTTQKTMHVKRWQGCISVAFLPTSATSNPFFCCNLALLLMLLLFQLRSSCWAHYTMVLWLVGTENDARCAVRVQKNKKTNVGRMTFRDNMFCVGHSEWSHPSA